MPSAKPVTSVTRRARAEYAKIPVKTKDDDPSTYTKNPHLYGDVLIKPDRKGRTRLGGVLQRDLVYWIERRTWGTNVGTKKAIKRPEYAKLSLGELVKLTGCDRRTVARAVADLIERGIIECCDRKGCGPTVAKMYKLTPERWKEAPYYNPSTAELAAEAEEQEPEEETTAPESATFDPEQTVQPGKVSKPQSMPVNIAKGSPDVTIRLVYHVKECPVPLTFSARSGRNGRVQISCRGTAPQFSAVSSPVISPVSVEKERLESYRSWITDFALDYFGKSPDETLITSIVAASEGAPIEVYQAIVEAKGRAMKKSAC